MIEYRYNSYFYMIFLYLSQAGTSQVTLTKTDENFLYLTKVKRCAVGEEITLSNLEDQKFYTYIFSEISKKTILLSKTETLHATSLPSKKIHLIWGICDFKTISKTLPFLNELGVEKITFLNCERTQGNFLIQLEKNIFSKLQKILEQSCQQCGRNSRMTLEIKKFSEISDVIHCVSGVCNTHIQNLYICDFPAQKNFPENVSCRDTKSCVQFENIIVIGPEGGFSPDEKKYFQKNVPENIYQFNTSNITRSETAVIGLAGKFLL